MTDVAVLEPLRALARVDWGAATPAVLPYWPVSAGNPVQRLMVGRMPAHGIEPVPVPQLPALLEVCDRLSGSVDVVAHLHWLSPVLSRAEDEAHARSLADAFEDSLDRLVGGGTALLWTVHNVLPHAARFPEVEARVHQAVADRARIVHVMDPRTVEACAPWYRLDPARVVGVPHPSYAGVHAPLPPRRDARRALGIPEDAQVLLVLGRLEPYKGLDELAEALPLLAPGTLLVLAGPVDGDAEQRARLERLALRRDVLLMPGYVDDAQVPVLLAAADAMPLPYRRVLNSGALALAATAGLPVVVPHGTGTGWVSPGWAVEHDADDPGSLAGALRAVRDLAGTASARDAALAAAAAHDPSDLAERLAAAVAARLPLASEQP